jgi:hypothetical protein
MTLAQAVLSFVVAVVARLRVRRPNRMLAQITELYWQLRYDHGELKAAVTPPSEPPAPPAQFVPLGSITRSKP